jgi:competence protein ComEC
VAGAALAGCACVALWPALPGVAAAWAMLALGAVLHARGVRVARGVGALLLGIAWTWIVADARLAQRVDGRLAGRDVVVVGAVVGLPQVEARSTRFDLQVDPDSPALADRRLRLAWYDSDRDSEASADDAADRDHHRNLNRADARPMPGSRWSLRVRVRPPHGVADPGGFDAERHAIVEGIDALGSVRGDAHRLAPAAGIDAARARLSAAIATRVRPRDARFVRALALGDTRWLTDADWDVLRATGLTHLIAISGFHVGLVAGLGAGLAFAFYRLVPGAGRRWPRPQAMAAGALAFATAYTALAGFALPTVRTLLMIAVVLLARALRRGHRSGDAFALALLAVLAFDPLAVLAPGFWLSFVGVGWLLWCLPANTDDGRVRPFLAGQAIAGIGLLPLAVGFFGQQSLVAPLTNLVAIPVISLGVVPLALAGTAAMALPGPLADGLLTAAAVAMDVLWQAMTWVAGWPVGVLAPAQSPGIALALAGLGACWTLLPRGTPCRWLGAVLMLPLLWPAVLVPTRGVADIVVLDVGQGLSVLVRTRSHALLYDAGPGGPQAFDHGAATVVPALRALGVRRLDAIVVSHGDSDHAGGLAAVRAAFPGTPVFAPEGWALPGMAACRRGQRWRWDGIAIDVLHPPPHFPYLRNDSSCVLRVAAGRTAALLPGDIGALVERRLVREHAGRLHADLLLVPHHGSRTSSDPAFVKAVAPRLAVFATGADNRFGLPRAAVVQRYRAVGARVLGSAGNGAIRIELRPDGAIVTERRRQDRPRWWRERHRYVGAD